MTRKSVSYLTRVRKDVTNALAEVAETARDFQEASEDLAFTSPELIRTDSCQAYKEWIQAERVMQKAIKAQKLAVKTLKNFF